MTPAGGDRFLGMGELAVLAGAHEEADTSSRLGSDYTEDLCWFPFRRRKCGRFKFGKCHQCQLPSCKHFTQIFRMQKPQITNKGKSVCQC